MYQSPNCCKGKGLDTCYSATYTSQSRDQQRFTISEVAADWHEPILPQRIMWPSISRTNGQLINNNNNNNAICIAQIRRKQQMGCGPTVHLADTPSPQSVTLGLHHVAVATTHFPSRLEG